MLKMEQLEQLEGRIIRALDLISDLRLENTQLETQMDGLKTDNEKLQLTNSEQENKISSLKDELRDATEELSSLRSKEEQLESKILTILAKLENLKDTSNSTATKNMATPIVDPTPSISDNTVSNSEIAPVNNNDDNKIFDTSNNEEDFISTLDENTDIDSSNTQKEEHSMEEVPDLSPDEEQADEELGKAHLDNDTDQIKNEDNTDIHDNDILDIFDDDDIDDFLIVEEDDSNDDTTQEKIS